MVVQPFVGQHTTKENETERGVGLNCLPICTQMGLAQQFGTEAHLLCVLHSQAHGPEEHGQSDDIPQGQEYSRGLQKGREEHRVSQRLQVLRRAARVVLDKCPVG